MNDPVLYFKNINETRLLMVYVTAESVQFVLCRRNRLGWRRMGTIALPAATVDRLAAAKELLCS